MQVNQRAKSPTLIHETLLKAAITTAKIMA